MFNGRKIAVWDIEIKREIAELSNGWNSHDEMGISVLCVFDYETMRYRVFDDGNAKEGAVLLSSRDLIVGFNTVGFDTKVLSATKEWNVDLKPAVFKHYDVLREIWTGLALNPDAFNPKTHGGYKLDDVAFDTLGLRKSGDGAHAPKLYKAGRFAELHDYCIQDVKVEKELFEFAIKYGYVLRNGKKIKMPGLPS